MAVVNMNGELVAKEKATVNVYDHGLLYGDGVFEGIRFYAGKVFRQHAHLARLYESAKHVLLEIPWPRDRMRAEVEKTVKASGLSDGYIRLVVTRGVGTRGLDPARCSQPQVFV